MRGKHRTTQGLSNRAAFAPISPTSCHLLFLLVLRLHRVPFPFLKMLAHRPHPIGNVQSPPLTKERHAS